jgi:neutral ceramidase
MQVWQALFCVAGTFSFIVAAASSPVPTGAVMAGASKVDLEIPVGVPLSGYNHGTRRVPHWPLKQVTQYTSYMMPSVGQLEPSYARALYIQDPDGNAVCYLSCDIIGMDGAATAAAVALARSQGFPLTDDEVVFGASHSHSTAGAVTSNKLWELAPATDLLVPKLLDSFVKHLAMALVQAHQSAVNATVGISTAEIHNVTDNRRQHESPYVNASSIDPYLTVIRVDDVQGKPIATLWNFATHGTCKPQATTFFCLLNMSALTVITVF